MNELIYGIRNADGKTVSIDEIPVDTPGLSCDCVCAFCGGDLQACSLNGKVRRYFRHHVDSRDDSGSGGNGTCNAETANETALHQMAKEIIAEEKKVFVPSKNISLQEAGISDLPSEIARQIPCYERQKAVLIEGQSVELEKHLDGFTPDAVVRTSRGELLIEVFVRHRVDAEKEEKVKKYGAAMLEIDLSDYAETPIHRDKLREIIESGDQQKKWIFYPLSEKALQNAYQYYENNGVVKKYRAELEEKKKKEQREREERVRRNNKIQHLFDPTNYTMELNRFRDDDVFAETYGKWHRGHWYHFGKYFQKHRSVPFFVDIPIAGEMVFQCDRRIWQSLLFNRFIYGRKEIEAKFSTESLFDCLVNDYAVGVDYDLTYKLDNPLHEEDVLRLRRDVVERYIHYLEIIGFIITENPTWRNKQACWKTVQANKTIVPPNKEAANYLQTVLKSVDLRSPDIDRLIAEKLDVFYEEKIQKDLATREAAEREAEEKAHLERIKQEAEEELRLYNSGLEYVQKFNFDENKIIFDQYNRRWVQCVFCNKIKRLCEMDSYEYGKGECHDCRKNKIENSEV
ncbi:MAG: hypothetical protein E7610_06965 [Ruminococcaceae bacterium]|nr:hypothetical protein [Oscillospiraceae bacterium]